MDLEQRLVEELTSNPGQKVEQLVNKLAVPRHEILQLLSNRFEQDSTYRWWPLNQSPSQNTRDYADDLANTPLARLCQYYLSCLAQDSIGEISTCARDQDGNSYVVLKEIPTGRIDEVLQESEPAKLLSTMKRDRGFNVLYLGYPIHIRQSTSRTGKSIYSLEPIFHLPIEFEHPNNRGAASVSDDYPSINKTVVKRFSNANNDTWMQELSQLEYELGFSNTDAEIPELDEVAQRLCAIRNEWPWRESCDGGTLPETPPIHELDESGIYNRAVLVAVEREPFTQGLEHELHELGKLEASKYAHTILGKLVNNDIASDGNIADRIDPLLEVHLMNTEQRQAIRRSLTETLTIVTGPPGTGKSQVVTNLLINAAWQDKKILFASRNNKAVDIVETRVNSLGSRPILLRLGSSKYREKLNDYLQNLLSATAGRDQELDYDETLAVHRELTSRTEDINTSLEQVVALRNKVDILEQSVEYLRPKLSNEIFQFVRKHPDADFEASFKSLFNMLARADKSKQNLLIRLLWLFMKKSRISQVIAELASLDNQLMEIGLSIPSQLDEDEEFSQFSNFADRIKDRLDEIEKVSAYFKLLHCLQEGESLESLNQEHRQLLSQIADNSHQLWINWLKITPAKLSQKNRQLLSQYSSVVKMVIGSHGRQLEKSIWRKYYSLNQKISHLMPCWAVTSLSARGKLPFTAGYYDLVVFDEASQCDIASALPLLYRAKSAVIIGDPQQLSHISRVHEQQDQKLLVRFDIIDKFVDWAYSSNSLFEMARAYVASKDIVNLRDHHRSHADIINFSNIYFYEEHLRIATPHDRLKSLGDHKQGESAVRWIDVKGSTVRPATGGAFNRQEADAVVHVLKRLLLEYNYPGSIGVVSPFRAQVNRIKELCIRNDLLQRRLDDAGFISDTVHGFQGDERDLIIFSPVISENTSEQSLHFLRTNRNLFNVAITRARANLLVVGDKTIARNCRVEYMEQFAQYVEQLNNKSNLTEEIKQNIEYESEYPKSIDRSEISDWEIMLYESLYREGIRPIPQYRIDKYVLDLAVIDGDRRLDVEVDGERYHRNWTGELCRRDQIRNQRLYELGWDVMRFWVYEIRDEMDTCVTRVKRWLEKP